MLKIGWVIGNLQVHGSVRRVVEMSNALLARGHWVTIYTVAGEPLCRWLPCAARIQPVEAMQEESHHALIFSGATKDAYDKIEAARCPVRILYVLALDERNLDAIVQSDAKPTRRFVDAARSPLWTVCANSTWQWEWLCENIRPNAYLLIGGINRTIFHPEHVERDPARRIILTSGRKREREGSGTVADAVNAVAVTHPNVTRVTYGGLDQDAMRRVYCEADVFADGQWYAGWANAVIEAMACGTPVVCTDIGGVRDFARHEETALLVPVGDVSAMADAIRRLLDDVELRQRLTKAALMVVDSFSYATAAGQLERIIQERLTA